MLRSETSNPSSNGPCEPVAVCETSRLPDIEPNCLRSLMQVGYLAVGRGYYAEARAIFQGLVTLRPGSEIPLLGLAVTEWSIGNLDKAWQWLDAATRLQPNARHTLAIAEVLLQSRVNQAH